MTPVSVDVAFKDTRTPSKRTPDSIGVSKTYSEGHTQCIGGWYCYMYVLLPEKELNLAPKIGRFEMIKN